MPSINPSVIIKFLKKSFLGKAGNRTLGSWVRSYNATSVLCSHIDANHCLLRSSRQYLRMTFTSSWTERCRLPRCGWPRWQTTRRNSPRPTPSWRTSNPEARVLGGGGFRSGRLRADLRERASRRTTLAEAADRLPVSEMFFFGCCKNARLHFKHYTIIRLNANDFQFFISLHFFWVHQSRKNLEWPVPL